MKTEIFVHYPDDIADRLADIIDDFLEASGSELDARDILEIKMKPSPYYFKEYREAWDRSEISQDLWPENPGSEDIRRFIETGHSDYATQEGLDYPKWSGIEVTPKDPRYTRLAEKIEGLFGICYCEVYDKNQIEDRCYNEFI